MSAADRRMCLVTALWKPGSSTIGPNQCSTWAARPRKPGKSCSRASLTITQQV